MTWAIVTGLIVVAAIAVERERVARNNLIVSKMTVRGNRRIWWRSIGNALGGLLIVAIACAIAYLVATGPTDPVP